VLVIRVRNYYFLINLKSNKYKHVGLAFYKFTFMILH